MKTTKQEKEIKRVEASQIDENDRPTEAPEILLDTKMAAELIDQLIREHQLSQQQVKKFMEKQQDIMKALTQLKNNLEQGCVLE